MGTSTDHTSRTPETDLDLFSHLLVHPFLPSTDLDQFPTVFFERSFGSFDDDVRSEALNLETSLRIDFRRRPSGWVELLRRRYGRNAGGEFTVERVDESRKEEGEMQWRCQPP
jgi:hypothetical protein